MGIKLTHVVSLVHIQVCVHITLVCAPDGTSHTWPWLLERKNTLDIISMDLLAGDRVDDRRFNAKEWQRSRSRLGRGNTGKRSDNVGSGLGLPVCLILVSYFTFDIFMIHLHQRREPPPFRQSRNTISKLLLQLARRQSPRHGDASFAP